MDFKSPGWRSERLLNARLVVCRAERNVLGARKKLEMKAVRSLIITFDCFSKCLRQQNILSAVGGGWVEGFVGRECEYPSRNQFRKSFWTSLGELNWKVAKSILQDWILRSFDEIYADSSAASRHKFHPKRFIYFAVTQNLFTLSNINSVAQNHRHGACVEEKSSFLVHAKLPSVENLDRDYSGLFSRLSPPSQFFSKRNSHQARVANFSPESG